MNRWDKPKSHGSAMIDLIQLAGMSDIGRVRDNNEDNFFIADLAVKTVCDSGKVAQFPVSDKGTILLVSDGMGGRNAGEVASQLVVDTFHNELLSREPRQLGCELLAEIAKKANWAVWSRSQRNPDEQGMGATLTAMLIERNKAHIVQIGDSRAYVVRNETIFQLTKDQSMVQTLIDSGIIKPEEAETHPYRHVILQSIGGEPTVYPVTSTIDLYDGDYIMLCSDGLSGMLTNEMLQELILAAPDIESGCRGLVDMANLHGGKDNITVILGVLEYGVSIDPDDVDFDVSSYSSVTTSSTVSQVEAEVEVTADFKVEKVDTPFPPIVISKDTEKPPVPTEAKERILVVVSNTDMLESLQYTLSPYYELVVAKDGEEGFAKTITEHPRLIVASVELDKINGIDLCQALKASERFKNIPMVLISGSRKDKEQVIEGLSKGASEYLTLPIDERELILRIKPHVERAKLLEKLRYESAYNEAASVQLQLEMEEVEETRQIIFQTIVDASSDGILILDPAGWVTAVNGTFERFHKVQKEQIIGFGYRALLRKIQHMYENPERQVQRFTELISSPEMVADDEIRVLQANGRSPFKTKRYSAPVTDAKGKVYGRFFVFRNLVN
ncbi:MAG: protein phosphatase 2C domain-containing protein [Blastocatellia bacterium]|nr:protein phosphatase 2C domain-containing protein [Blastocatellia bacterium]